MHPLTAITQALSRFSGRLLEGVRLNLGPRGFAAFVLLFATSPLWAQTLPSGVIYSSGFESSGFPSFIPGDLQGQGGWMVHSGEAAVQSENPLRGAQSVRARSAVVELAFPAADAVVWIDMVIAETGTDFQPMIPTTPASGVLVFSASRGILALDGDGEGNGVFMALAGASPALSGQRLSVRLDYSSHRYDVWIDGARQRAGLGFKDRAVNRLESFRWITADPAMLDDFSVTLWGLDSDQDADGLPDLDEVKFHRTDPSLADTDGDGISDGQEVRDGTDPLIPNTAFALSIEFVGATHHRIGFPTVTGRRYVLEERPNVSPAGTWSLAGGVPTIVGSGTPDGFLLPNGTESVFYRVTSDP